MITGFSENLGTGLKGLNHMLFWRGKGGRNNLAEFVANDYNAEDCVPVPCVTWRLWEQWELNYFTSAFMFGERCMRPRHMITGTVQLASAAAYVHSPICQCNSRRWHLASCTGAGPVLHGNCTCTWSVWTVWTISVPNYVVWHLLRLISTDYTHSCFLLHTH